MTFLSIVPTTAEASTPVKKEKEMVSPEDDSTSNDRLNKSIGTINSDNNNCNASTATTSVAELQATVQQQETALKKANDRLRLLDSIATVQRLYLQWEEPRVVFGTLLEKLLELMDSEYGFIGEIKVEINEKGEEVKYLQTHAITNIAWNAATHQFYNDNIESGLKFYNLQSLFGQVVLSQETMIANDPSTNKYACGVPEGHPPLNHFLGIPFFEAKGSRSSSNSSNNSGHSNADGKRIMNGMVGIANKPGGYTQEDVDFLEPFLTTCSNLIQSYAAIRQNKELVETLEEKVEERTRALKQANSSLEQANQRVLAASQAQLQHFACMSHEIRTPLNCIIGLSSLLQETELNPYQGDCLKMIVTSGDLLLTVVNDVLDYSKLESGNVDISIRPINLQTCLDAVVHSIHQKAKPRGLQMDTRYSAQVPEVVDTDNRRLQQILYNLLGNAVKFSKPGATVEFHVELLENTKDMEKTVGKKTNDDDHGSNSRNVQKPLVRRKSDPGLHLAKESHGTSTTTEAASAKCPYHTGTTSDATTMLMDPDTVCPPMLKRLDTQSEENIMESEEGEPLAQAATTTATLHSTSKSTSTATPLFSLEPTKTPSQSFTVAPPPKCPFHAALHPKNSNDNDTNVDAGKSEEKSMEAHPNASDIDENQTKTTNTRNDAPVNVNVDALVASNFKEETPARPKPMRRSHSSRARLMANDDDDDEDSSDDFSSKNDSSDGHNASSNSATNNNETKKCCHGAIINPDDCPYILRFRVKDYGTGIEKKDFNRIFRPFKQANSQTETLYGGTGLGLAITTKLVKGLGGRISVDSVLDEWTEFSVDFPFSKAPFDVQQEAATLRQSSPATTLWSVHNTPEVSRFCQTVLEDHGVPCQKFDNMQSMLESIKASPNRDGIQFLLVDEALYDGKAYAEFQQATGTNNNDTSCKTALITHGPNYSISEASLHFRSLRQVLPSVLMGSLTTMLKKATAVESNGEKADAKMEVNKPLSYDKLRILIAEDNVINQKVLSRMLHRSGIRDIDIADNGQIAVDKTAEKEYDIIFMDIGMPVLGGLDATKIITERDPSAKVVMCTAHALEEFRKLAESVGAASYVSKPFRPKDLEECFNELGFKK